MLVTHHEFRDQDLIGGNLALDFVNTVTARDASPRDWLHDFAALLQWGGKTGAFIPEDLDALARKARAHPVEAASALQRAKQVREALNSVTDALARGQTADGAALATLDAAWHAAMTSALLTPCDSGLRPAWRIERSGFDLIAHVVTERAVALFGSTAIDQIKLCDGTSCGWFFVDVSKNGRRRWCDMATCGNLAKARRHQQRHRPPRADRRTSKD